MTKATAYPGRVIFDHLPKTGGLAVKDWLSDNLGSACVAHVISGRHKELIKRYGGEYSIICSHVAFAPRDNLDSRYKYVTCLRDPIDRCLSWLYFAANVIPYDFIGEKVGANVRQLAQTAIASNGQELDLKLHRSIGNFCTSHFTTIMTDTHKRGGSRVDRAFAALTDFDVVGLYEDMPGFLGEFADLTGINAPQQIQRKNATGNRPSERTAAPALIEHLRAINADDIELYNRIKEWKLSRTPRVAGKPANVWIKRDLEPMLALTPHLTPGTASLQGSPFRFKGDELVFDIPFCLMRDVGDLNIRLRIIDTHGNLAFGTDSLELGGNFKNLNAGAYKVSLGLKAELPINGYTIGLEFLDRKPKEGGGELLLGRQDGLCPFSIYHDNTRRFEGYSLLPVKLSISGQPDAKPAITDGKGSVKISASIPRIASQGEANIPVIITNNSAQKWAGDLFRPLSMSYHLKDTEGKPIVFDGVRSPLPQESIAPGETVNAVMKISAPVAPGRYRLEPSLVQENVCWFENIGLTLEPVEVEIV